MDETWDHARVQQLDREFGAQVVPLPRGGHSVWRQAGPRDSAATVVLLHGISSGAASWLAVAQQLAGEVRVLAWDAPGYGDSTALPMAQPSDTDYAQVLADSLQALGVQRCVLVGHSLGALVAAAYARQASPGHVVQLVLISPAGGYGAPAQAEQQARVRSGRLQALAEQGVAGMAAVIDQRLLSPAADADARAWVRWNTARLHPQGYAQAVELLCTSDLGRVAGILSMPIQVWVGAEDVVTPPAACAAWAQRLGAPCGVWPHAGHASPIEQPQAVAAMLRTVLRTACA